MNTATLPTLGKVNLRESGGLHIISLAKPWGQSKE
jgi:hypothetical protein